MKIVRYQTGGDHGFGLLAEDAVFDLTDEFDSFAALLEHVTHESDVPEAENEVSEYTLLPPTTSTNTVFAVGLNYRSHINETSQAEPERPLVFLKLYRSLVGHEAPIKYHTFATNKLDYEAELAAVVGKRAWKVSKEDARDYVAGYTILNDTSARDLQRMDVGGSTRLDWFSAKAMQDTTPVGPHIVTGDEITDPHELHIQSRLNGELMQDEGTGLMIRNVDDLVSYLSHRVELEPGDVIATGTPEGVGAFQDIKLEDGDTVEITIDRIGTLSNTVRTE